MPCIITICAIVLRLGKIAGVDLQVSPNEPGRPLQLQEIARFTAGLLRAAVSTAISATAAVVTSVPRKAVPVLAITADPLSGKEEDAQDDGRYYEHDFEGSSPHSPSGSSYPAHRYDVVQAWVPQNLSMISEIG